MYIFDVICRTLKVKNQRFQLQISYFHNSFEVFFSLRFFRDVVYISNKNVTSTLLFRSFTKEFKNLIIFLHLNFFFKINSELKEIFFYLKSRQDDRTLYRGKKCKIVSTEIADDMSVFPLITKKCLHKKFEIYIPHLELGTQFISMLLSPTLTRLQYHALIV